MDQALKSALNKYQGKNGIIESKEKSSTLYKVFLGSAVVLSLFLVASVFVRYDVLGAGQIWENIKEITVGEQTVGVIIDGLGEKIGTVFSQNNEIL